LNYVERGARRARQRFIKIITRGRMSGDFQNYGRALIANGYLVVPIKVGHKRPALDNWQTARLGVGDIERYRHSGIGVLCGQGAHPIAAIDIDTTNQDLARKFADWCADNLGITCERVGFAPKLLLPYRAASEGWGKATGAWFAKSWQPGPSGKYFSGGHVLGADGKPEHKEPVHRLEVLGKGQQFVAYHVHPDTGLPYEWIDMLGGIESVRANELPVITEDQVAQALATFERMAAAAGLTQKPGSAARVGHVTSAPDDDPLMSYEPPIGLPLADVQKLLAFVDNEDYDTWLKVGMSLHHEYEGSSDALELWDTWSSTASNYASRDDLAFRWDGFGNSGSRPTTAKWLLKIGNQNKRDAQRAEKRNALQEARDLIKACEDQIDLVNVVARKAGEAAGEDLGIRAELAGLIRERFNALTGQTLPIADVRTAMAPGKRSVSKFTRPRRERTEFGNAERMLDHYGDGLMFVPETNAWYVWTSVYWRRAAGVELEHLAKETIRALPDELKDIDSDEEREAFFKFCAVSQRAAMVGNIVKLAQSDPRVVVPVANLDSDHRLLGVANGAVDLRTGKLLPPSQEHRITTITPVEYDRKAGAPLFEQTVADVFFGDPEMVAFFQRLIGYAILGKPDEDVLVIPYGSGSNGKSTVLGAIRNALGEHARTANADTFLSSGQSGAAAGAAREDVLRLRGARFVYVSEPDEGSELREGMIKSMTGGDPIPARGLWSATTVEVIPTWAVFMPTNHLPIVKGDDHAIWRRLLPVPFTRNFDKDPLVEKDPDRASKLAAEAEGILRWCIAGAVAYQLEGLNPPAKVKEARDGYKKDMDLLAEWIDECCDTGPDLVETNAKLWASWESFARSRGELRFISSTKSLGRRLQSRGMRPIKDEYGLRGRGVLGMCVRVVGDFE
jgi:P4 family phage/plasmid primase-like protien